MSRLRWLGIAVAALAVTALLIFAAGKLGELFLSFALSDSASVQFWWTFVVSALPWVIIGVGLYQRRLNRRHHGRSGLLESRSDRAFGLPESRLRGAFTRTENRPRSVLGFPENRARGAFWFGMLVILATSLLCFIASAYCVFTPSPHLPGSVRWGMALFLAAIGVGLPMLGWLSRPRSR
jgi:hypothetical protein